VAHRQCRGLGYRAADAAPGAAAADWNHAASDVPHWAWHEYGNRVGFWRLKAALDRLKITPSLSVNARVCIDYPRIARAARDAGWEFMGHSYDQRPIHLEPNQRATIRKAVRVIKEYTGKQPVGWLGPGFTQTLDTPEFWLKPASSTSAIGRSTTNHARSRQEGHAAVTAVQHRA